MNVTYATQMIHAKILNMFKFLLKFLNLIKNISKVPFAPYLNSVLNGVSTHSILVILVSSKVTDPTFLDNIHKLWVNKPNNFKLKLILVKHNIIMER